MSVENDARKRAVQQSIDLLQLAFRAFVIDALELDLAGRALVLAVVVRARVLVAIVVSALVLWVPRRPDLRHVAVAIEPAGQAPPLAASPPPCTPPLDVHLMVVNDHWHRNQSWK